MSIQIFVFMNSNEYYYDENLESGHLKSYLSKKGVETSLKYINTDKFDKYEQEINLDAVLYAFALTETNINYVFNAITLLKQKNRLAKVCVFDTFASYNWKNILHDNKEIDFIPFGNSYETIYDAYVKIKDGCLISDNSNENLLISPEDKQHKYIKNDFLNYTWANRDNLKSRNVIIAHLISSYGCPSRCSFCTMPQIDNSLSYRDVEDVFNEIIYLYNKYKIRFFHFNDATFEGVGEKGKERMEKLCNLLISYPIKFSFRCFVRAGSFVNEEDEKYLRLLKKAGFNNIFVGIESGCDEDLLVYNKRSELQDNERFMMLCDKCGITPFYGFVMIQPYSTVDSVNENYRFLIKYRSDQLSHYINCLQIYSNTPIFLKVKADNLIYDDYDYKNHPYQYSCDNTMVNDMKRFLEENFYNDSDLQKLNSSYHNFIFLRKYMSTIGVSDENVDKKSKIIEESIFELCKEFFFYLYVEQDIEICEKKVKEFLQNIKEIYILVQPLKEKLLKIYLEEQILNEAAK